MPLTPTPGQVVSLLGSCSGLSPSLGAKGLRSDMLALSTEKPREAQGPAAGHSQCVAEPDGSSLPTCCLCICPPREDMDHQTPGYVEVTPEHTGKHRARSEGQVTIPAVGPSAVDGMTWGSRCLDGEHPRGGPTRAQRCLSWPSWALPPQSLAVLGKRPDLRSQPSAAVNAGSDAGPAPLRGRSLSPR